MLDRKSYGMIVTFIAVVLITTGTALAEPQVLPTVGRCYNSTHIVYTTNVQISVGSDVDDLEIESDPIRCANGCMEDTSVYGDSCAVAEETSIEMVVIWALIWLILGWFYRKWKKMAAPLMWANSWGGILIVQSVLLLIPIVVTTLLTLWVWGILKFNKDWFDE